MCISCDKTFHMVRPFTWCHNFWPCDLVLEVWPTFENFNLGCYLLMVAAPRASLSSDNFYFFYKWALFMNKIYTLTKTEYQYFYSPAMKWPGHIVLPLSVIPSFCHSVIPDSVSTHCLCHTWRFSNEILYMGLSRTYAGWVWIRVRSNNFRQSYAPWTSKNSINFQFPLIIFITNWHLELKFSI